MLESKFVQIIRAMPLCFVLFVLCPASAQGIPIVESPTSNDPGTITGISLAQMGRLSEGIEADRHAVMGIRWRENRLSVYPVAAR